MMDLALGHYPRPQSIVDFKLDALDGRSLSSSWFKTKQMTTTERDLPIATNQHSLPAQPRWFRCDEATILRLYLSERNMKKIAATNDVGDDGIVDGSSAITKTMRIRACLIGRQSWIPFFGLMFSRHARELCGSRKSWGCGNENFTENSCSWTDQNTNIVFYKRPITHFHIQ